jgi:hypothetical protein
MMHHRSTPSRPNHLWTLCGLAVVLAVFVTGCEGKVVTPTTPTQPQTQTQTQIPTTPAYPAAELEDTLDSSLKPACNSNGDCLDGRDIQNVGNGCASGTTAVMRYFAGMGSHVQVGPDFPMDVVGGGLAAKIIRPNEIVVLVTLDYVPSSLWKFPTTYWIFLTWNTVACPGQ